MSRSVVGRAGRLVNGSFSLAAPLRGRRLAAAGDVKTYAGPVSNDPVTIAFRQSVGANEPLRTGSYSRDADVHVVDDESP